MNIFVGNLSFEAKEIDVQRVFTAFGVVTSVAIVMEKKGKKSRGFGFVEMPDEVEAQAAITALNGKEILGRPINVMPAVSKEPKVKQEDGEQQSESSEQGRYAKRFSGAQGSGSGQELVYKRTGRYREGRRTINYLKKNKEAGIPVSAPRKYKSNPMRWRKKPRWETPVSAKPEGEQKPWQRPQTESNPWKKPGARSGAWKKPEGEPRPWQRAQGETKPWEKSRGGARPWAKEQGSESKPWGKTREGSKPWVKSEERPLKPWHKKETESKPWEKSRGRSKPWLKPEGSESKPWQKKDDASRPWKKSTGESKPWRKASTDRVQSGFKKRKPFGKPAR